jgi:hypothetical protein
MKPLFHVSNKLLLAAIFVLTLATAHAQSAEPGEGQNVAANVKYLGTQDDMIVFNVSYPNPEGTKFMLAIKDQDGSTIYQNTFSDKVFYKQFMLPKADKDRVVFIFHNGHDADFVKEFEVNVNSRFIREVAIKKVN